MHAACISIYIILLVLLQLATVTSMVVYLTCHLQVSDTIHFVLTVNIAIAIAIEDHFGNIFHYDIIISTGHTWSAN